MNIHLKVNSFTAIANFSDLLFTIAKCFIPSMSGCNFSPYMSSCHFFYWYEKDNSSPKFFFLLPPAIFWNSLSSSVSQSWKQRWSLPWVQPWQRHQLALSLNDNRWWLCRSQATDRLDAAAAHGLELPTTSMWWRLGLGADKGRTTKVTSHDTRGRAGCCHGACTRGAEAWPQQQNLASGWLRACLV
jgi:hypothetical protein